MEKKLCLSIGDEYDFNAMNYVIDRIIGDCICIKKDKTKNIIVAEKKGKGEVYTIDKTGKDVRFQVIVYANAKELGDNFNLDQGMFKNKKVIVFGDSITDGVLLDSTKPDGLNYEDTYFARLCRYLKVASDPTDLKNCNLACGATCISYRKKGLYCISGVERVSLTKEFSDDGRIRSPYNNMSNADLCIIYYGTNDFNDNVYSSAEKAPQGSGLTDYPNKMTDALTIKGSLYYMINILRKFNPNMKILVLPPIYRRVNENISLTKDGKDVYNIKTLEKLSDYAKVMENTCQEFGAKFINWYSIFNYENFGKIGISTYSMDGLHPNAEGHRLMYEFIVNFQKNI